ncbi:MAG: HIT domain-containing protein [archaeon]
MVLSAEQLQQLKKQIIQQIESTFPEDKKNSAIQQIESMGDEQFVEFLKQNNLISQDFSSTAPQGRVSGESANGNSTSQCVFCSILEEKIPSYKVDENKEAVAVLEINPISKAHSLIIPKKHLSSSAEIPQQVFSLAKKISKKIKTKFKPVDIQISSSNLFGHEIINILPIYKNENLGSERKPAEKEELEKLQKILEKKPRKKIIKKMKAKEIKEEKIWLPKRIP